ALVHGLEVKAFDTVVLVVLGRVPRRQGKGGDDRQDEEEKGGAQSKIGFHRIRIRGPEPRPATPWPQNCEARGRKRQGARVSTVRDWGTGFGSCSLPTTESVGDHSEKPAMVTFWMLTAG